MSPKLPTCYKSAESFLRSQTLGVSSQTVLKNDCDKLRIVVKSNPIDEHDAHIVWQSNTILPIADRAKYEARFLNAAKEAFLFWKTLQ